MLVVQRWILARLRNRQFFSLRELNLAIAELLTDLNRRPFKKLPGSRLTAFESIDRPAMKPLPPTRYEYAEWSKAKVGIDYHADGDRPLLQRAAHAGRRARHGAPHRHDRRVLLQGPPRRRPRAQLPEGQAYDAARAHAECASQTHEVDAGAAPELGSEHRRRHPRRGAVAAREPAPPRAGLPGMPGASKSVENLRRGASGGGVPPRARHRRHRTRKRIIAILKAKLDQHPDLFPAADTAAATASRTHGNVRGADYFRDSTTNTETTTTDEGDDDSCLPNPRSIH